MKRFKTDCDEYDLINSATEVCDLLDSQAEDSWDEEITKFIRYLIDNYESILKIKGFERE